MSGTELLVLAIESSSHHATVALLRDGRLECELALAGTGRTAQLLAPAIQQLLFQHGQSPRDLGLLAVAIGPGSFTGLRVGVSTAKTLGWALGIPVAPVGVLAAIAHQAGGPAVTAAINAYRGQVFSASYQRAAPSRWVETEPVRTVALAHWAEEIRRAPLVSGPALSLLAEIPADAVTAPAPAWNPSARSIGELGWAAHLAGESVPAIEVTVAYGRRSAAEEKRQK